MPLIYLFLICNDQLMLFFFLLFHPKQLNIGVVNNWKNIYDFFFLHKGILNTERTGKEKKKKNIKDEYKDIHPGVIL